MTLFLWLVGSLSVFAVIGGFANLVRLTMKAKFKPKNQYRMVVRVNQLSYVRFLAIRYRVKMYEITSLGSSTLIELNTDPGTLKKFTDKLHAV